MTRRAAAVGFVVLIAILGVLIAVLTPWHPLAGSVPGGHVKPDAALDFTPAQIARETSFHNQIRPWGLFGLALSIVVPALLGFTRLGSAVVSRVDLRLRRRGEGESARRAGRLVAAAKVILAVLVGTLLVTGLTFLVLLPVAWHEHVIERRFGLTHQAFAGWLSNAALGYLVTIVSSTAAVLVIVGFARKSPRRWWAYAAASGALLVIIASYVYPFTVEPLTTTTTSLPAGPLRTELLALARSDGQPLKNILVAHEGGRTTEENAYVSGFGGSRRLVLYDTLLKQDTPREIKAITAHELGHSKHHDIIHGTIEGAVGVAAAMCLAGLLLGEGGAVPRRVWATSAGDPRLVPLLLASYTVVAFAISPLYNVVSRHVEAHADAHSLSLDRDPDAFVAAQRKLALSGLDDLKPSGILYVLFFDHPSSPQRIAMARDWARQHHVAEPPPVSINPR